MNPEKHSDVSIPMLNTDEGATIDRRQAIAATLDQASISHRAYQIYIESGCPQGQTNLNWQEAQRQLIDEAIELEDSLIAIAHQNSP